MNILSKRYWERSQWEFYRPECYSEMYAARLKNHSLAIAGFYYGDFKTYPLHSFLKSAYRKLFCRKDSRMAYDGYKKLLATSGFSITEGLNSFTARNESLVIYCRLDSKDIMVARAEKAEEMLLNAVLNSV